MYDIVGIDTPCIDLNVNMSQFPKKGHGEGIKNLSWQGGGKVATGVIASARLGARCAIMGRVGDDINGQFIVSDFNRHGVDTSALKIIRDKTTNMSVVLSESLTSTRTILHRGGTASGYDFNDFDIDLLTNTKYLFICSANPVVQRAVDIAKDNAKIFIDADGYSKEIMEMLNKINIFIGSEKFYHALFDNDQYEKNCNSIIEKGPEIAIFTFGENGCAGVSNEGYFYLPAFNVQAVDTVGAGDVFHGAFIAELAKGYSVKESARRASAVAAIKCTRIGGRAGIPDIKTLDEFLSSGNIDYSEIDKRVEFYSRGIERE